MSERGIVMATGSYRAIPMLERGTLLFPALPGIATGRSWLFYLQALQQGKASEVSPIDKSSLAPTLIFAAFFLHEPLTLRTAPGAALIIAATLVIIL